MTQVDSKSREKISEEIDRRVLTRDFHIKGIAADDQMDAKGMEQLALLSKVSQDIAARIQAGERIDANWEFQLGIREALAKHEAEHEATKAENRERRRKENQDKFIAECVAMEADSAHEAGAIGYMARVLVQATMPHSCSQEAHFVRRNGTLTVEIGGSRQGLPYGSYPRLLLAWLTTEAVSTGAQTLYLGDSLSQFMRKLDLLPTGGRWGTLPRLADQAGRLFKSRVIAYETHSDSRNRAAGERGGAISVADDWDLWWDPKEAEQGTLFQSWVKLTDKFFNQITDRPVPIDLRAISALKKSPLALDLYAWATYRMSYLGHRTEIPWELLQMQFGSDYADSPKGRRNFKGKLLAALRKVTSVYPELRASEGNKGLLLLPSPTHIRRLSK